MLRHEIVWILDQVGELNVSPVKLRMQTQRKVAERATFMSGPPDVNGTMERGASVSNNSLRQV